MTEKDVIKPEEPQARFAEFVGSLERWATSGNTDAGWIKHTEKLPDPTEVASSATATNALAFVTKPNGNFFINGKVEVSTLTQHGGPIRKKLRRAWQQIADITYSDQGLEYTKISCSFSYENRAMKIGEISVFHNDQARPAATLKQEDFRDTQSLTRALGDSIPVSQFFNLLQDPTSKL